MQNVDPVLLEVQYVIASKRKHSLGCGGMQKDLFTVDVNIFILFFFVARNNIMLGSY